MKKRYPLRAAVLLASLAWLSACTTTASFDDAEALIYQQTTLEEQAQQAQQSLQVEGEVPLAVAESEPEPAERVEELEEVVVAGRAPRREELIRDLVIEAQSLLEEAELVTTEKVGRARSCMLVPYAFEGISSWLQRLDRFAQVVERTKGAK
jgi:hypothetical protein